MSVNRTEVGNYVTAFSTTGGTAAVYAVQVPEPASFAILLGIGVIGLEIRAWRKRPASREGNGAMFSANRFSEKYAFSPKNGPVPRQPVNG